MTMMPVPWKLWEGQVVDLAFPLRRYLGGTDRTAVYLTQFGEAEPRNAAIKLVLSQTQAQDAELLSQWDRAAALSHPHLLGLLKGGTCQFNQLAVDYVVTEYADENLADVLAERPLAPAEVREMLAPLLDALVYVHAQGLVHGHVKPSNLMAVGDQLKLSVDGISLVGELGELPSTSGAYDPPEFAERGCSPIGDIWSFGMTLVEALTQQLPTQIGAKQEPVLPPTLPAEFLPLVRACLQPDPRKRAPLNEVVAMLQQPAMAAVGPAIPEPIQPPAKKRKWLGLVLASAAALVLAAILFIPRSEQPAASVKVEQAVAPSATTQVTAKPETPVPQVEVPVKPANKPPVAAPPPVPPETAPAAPPALSTRNRKMEARPEQVVHEVMPDVTEQARRTIRGKVTIKVLASVDASGHVANAKVESENSRYFARASLKAAEQWAFAPSDSPSEWLLRFEFTTKGTEVHPARVTR